MNWWVVVLQAQMGVLILRRRAFAIGGQVRAKDNVVPLRRSSAGWMPARMGRLSAGAGRRHPVTIRKASLMAGSMRQVWALRHQTGAQYSAVNWTRAKVAVGNVVGPAPQPEPASHLQSATRDVSFLRSNSRCPYTWATCPTLLRGIWAGAEEQGFVIEVDI